jgi:hypothetical protein
MKLISTKTKEEEDSGLTISHVRNGERRVASAVSRLALHHEKGSSRIKTTP